jgi:hypothetical protein
VPFVAIFLGGGLSAMSEFARREFLKFLAASPLFLQSPSASDALDVFDLEAAAQKAIPPAHWGYLMTGVDGEETLSQPRRLLPLSIEDPPIRRRQQDGHVRRSVRREI